MSSKTEELLKPSFDNVSALQKKIQELESKLEQLGVLDDDASDVEEKGRVQTRLTKSKGKQISSDDGNIGGPFTVQENPAFLDTRIKYFEELYAKQQADIASREKTPISVELSDGQKFDGKAWETTPMTIVKETQKFATIIARVKYINRLSEKVKITSGQDELDDLGDDDSYELWDLNRPLEGDCLVDLLDFEEPEAKMVFWHSSAHLLGECIECKLGGHLTVGPPIDPGFYYDAYLGDYHVAESVLKDLNKTAIKTAKQKQEFQRLVLSKEEALKMFEYNPYKVSIIKNKVQDGAMTSVYRNGPFVDLCLGPHLTNTGPIKAIELKQATTAFWLGQEGNDRLQRVHGVSFPDKKLLKEHKELVKKAAENDHRKKGADQELFFFNRFSPGSCFWKPAGAQIFTRLVDLMREKNRAAGYQEVVTPNVYNVDLWKVSGHWEHYRDDMFIFSDGEHKDNLFGLKPMNCPGHCLIFDNRVRSYRELPMRLCDFGVLHRNEASGALSGLTRVRRFQQDDAHIFCRPDQVKDEVLKALEVVKDVYKIFGLGMKFGRSTRPKKAIGLVDAEGNPDVEGIKAWDTAEAALSDALNASVGKGNWRDNPGDGAFYGPKIDIEVFDVMKRKHQCATIQLDFQLPKRFDLKYKTPGNEDQENFERPVIIHRAVLGSIERMTGILTEHFMGKWPFWLSPRQVMIVPVAPAFNEFAESLCETLFKEGFSAEVDLSTKTLNKKILLAQKEQFNFMFIVGEKEMESKSVSVRTRKNNQWGAIPLDEMIQKMKDFRLKRSSDEEVDKKL